MTNLPQATLFLCSLALTYKATTTHTERIVISTAKRLHERATILRYTYTVYLVNLNEVLTVSGDAYVQRQGPMVY